MLDEAYLCSELGEGVESIHSHFIAASAGPEKKKRISSLARRSDGLFEC